jgi:glutamate carboxypeptidase
MISNKSRNRCFLLLLVFGLSNAAAGLDENEAAMIEWIDTHAGDAVALLEETVNISSGTLNVAGVTAVGVVMRRELDALGLETQWIELPVELERAGHLVGRNSAPAGNKLLLIGHLDTVFEADDLFQAFSRNGNIATGPGVDDMKSGNVVIVYALKALQHIGVLESIPMVVFYTGDEEKAGRPLPVSRKELIEAGQ